MALLQGLGDARTNLSQTLHQHAKWPGIEKCSMSRCLVFGICGIKEAYTKSVTLTVFGHCPVDHYSKMD